MLNPNDIVITPEAVEAGRLYREAIKLGEAGKFDEALGYVQAIEETKFKLRVVFRNEALIGLVRMCCKAGEIEKASELARLMDLPHFQKVAFEEIDRYTKRSQS